MIKRLQPARWTLNICDFNQVLRECVEGVSEEMEQQASVCCLLVMRVTLALGWVLLGMLIRLTRR